MERVHQKIHKIGVAIERVIAEDSAFIGEEAVDDLTTAFLLVEHAEEATKKALNLGENSDEKGA